MGLRGWAARMMVRMCMQCFLCGATGGLGGTRREGQTAERWETDGENWAGSQQQSGQTRENGPDGRLFFDIAGMGQVTSTDEAGHPL